MRICINFGMISVGWVLLMWNVILFGNWLYDSFSLLNVCNVFCMLVEYMKYCCFK